MGLTFPILHDPSGDIGRIYQTTGVPETFLIGKDGIIYKKVTGGTHWDSPDNIALVVATPSPPAPLAALTIR